MPVINWILSQQVQLGMILCACLFVPWEQRRSCFVPRLVAGVCVLLALTDTLTFLPSWVKLLLYTALLYVMPHKWDYLLMNVLVIVFNYVASRFVIVKKKK